MKILQTCLSLSWGGLEMYALHTSLLLQNAGHEVSILCSLHSRLEEEAEKAGFNCYSVNEKSYLTNFLRIGSIIKKNSFDVIHSEASKDLWFLVPALHKTGKITPLILTKHVGSNVVKKDLFHRMLYKRVDLALAISSIIKKNLIDTTPLGDNRIQLLHDAINADRFDPAKVDKIKVRNEFNIKENEIVIGMTGRFSPGKGHEEFLYAAKELLSRHNNLRFMIVGEASRGEEAYADSIKNLVVEYGIQDKVVFTGYRSDIPDVLSAFDIFLFPSHAEAFGLALIEAMSMELPTVCSDSDGVLDIALDGVTSYLFTNGDGNDLSEKTERLIENSQKRFEFGKAGRERVLSNFDTDLFTKKLIQIYNEQISKKK